MSKQIQLKIGVFLETRINIKILGSSNPNLDNTYYSHRLSWEDDRVLCYSVYFSNRNSLPATNIDEIYYGVDKDINQFIKVAKNRPRTSLVPILEPVPKMVMSHSDGNGKIEEKLLDGAYRKSGCAGLIIKKRPITIPAYCVQYLFEKKEDFEKLKSYEYSSK